MSLLNDPLHILTILRARSIMEAQNPVIMPTTDHCYCPMVISIGIEAGNILNGISEMDVMGIDDFTNSAKENAPNGNRSMTGSL